MMMTTGTTTNTRGGGGRGGRRSSGGGLGGKDASKSIPTKPPKSKPASSRVERKAGKRAKQLETMAKKAREEDLYYQQCRKEAMTKKVGLRGGVKSKDELFGKQGNAGINFEKYSEIQVEVRHPSKEGSETATLTMQSFDDLLLTPQLKRNIDLMNYKHPTPIQTNAIPLAMTGNDLMCCAQTGSGKTCAFLLPVICALATSSSLESLPQDDKVLLEGQSLQSAKPRCLVLAPTRELASQIELEAEKLTHEITSISCVCVYGGANPRSQLRDLAYASVCEKHALIVVATPGRLTDFVDRSIISLSYVQYLILDEADRMLDMGFEPQIRKLVQKSGMTPKNKRQTLLFSATFPPEIQKLAAEFLRPYVWIAVGRVGSTTDSITQVLIKATPDKRHKLQLVVEALTSGPDGRTLIFVQKKRSATWLKKMLNKGGPDDGKPRFTPIKAVDIHGDRTQSQREAALASFRSGECRVLVATDVAARGLDISGVEHVINMDLPGSPEDFDSYTHRIGRTGRAGHVGLATSLFVPGDDPKVGNGRIASLLITQLREANQTVPDWLEQEVAGGGGGKKKVTPVKRKQQFSSTDVRQNGGRNGNSKRQERGSSNGGRGGRGRGGRGGRGDRGDGG